LLADLESGAATTADINAAAFKQIYGTDRYSFNEQQMKSGQNIEKLMYYADAIEKGYANEEIIGDVASILGVNKSDVKNTKNKKSIISDLRGRASL